MKYAKKKRKALWIPIVLTCLLAVILVIAVGAWNLFGEIVTAANTVTNLEDGLYSMEFQGDYGFDEFLEQGGAASDAEVAAYLTNFLSRGFYKSGATVETQSFGCSTIYLPYVEGGYVYGRNYDWAQCDAMIVHTKPVRGYESVSTCCLDFLGFGEDYAPDSGMMNKIMSIAAIYVPLDGLNEAGLMVADLMAGDDEATHQTAQTANLTTTTAIRLLLDKAATVEEAVSLLRQYNMHSSIGAAHHLSIADKTGRSVVVEYVNGEMLVTDTTIVTNHYLSDSPKKGLGSAQSHIRFDTLSQHTGPVGVFDMMALLRSVAQFHYPQSQGSYEKTMWSVAYNPQLGASRFCFNEQYDHSYVVTLGKDRWLSELALDLPPEMIPEPSTVPVTEPTMETAPLVNQTHVSAEFVIERFLAQRPDHKFFSDAAGNAYASKILLTFSTDITDFRFLKLESNVTEDGMFYCDNYTGEYDLDVLTANDLMVVETVLEGTLPTRGFSFTDASGNTRYFYLTLSGEDNVPLVVEW